ncbi:MAG: kinase [Rubrobacteraceae bacterium]
MRHLGHARGASGECGGRLSVSGSVPFGWGMGSSTSDVVASIRAVADSSGEELAPEAIARLAVEAEGASDPVMFGDRALLFAHREGRIVEDLGGTLPPLEVVGVFCSPDSNGTVETLDLPGPCYGRREITAFAALLRLLRRAVRERNARLVGEVASASARINQRHLPKPGFERLMEVACQTGALGLNVAHSGCVAGLLFDPGDPAAEYRAEEARRLLARLRLKSWRFNTGDPKQSPPSDKTCLEFWRGA